MSDLFSSAIVNHGFDDPDPDDPNIYDHGDGGAIVGFQYCDATITDNLIENNIIASNGSSYGIYASKNPPVIKYNDVWGHGAGNYSTIIGDQTGINGNVSVDPLFVDEPNDDYHLKSNGWRWDMLRNRWHYDDTTSRCTDAGNPGYALADEPLAVPDDPNGHNKRRHC